MMAAFVVKEQRKDGQKGCEEERSKAQRKRDQQTGKRSKIAQRNSPNYSVPPPLAGLFAVAVMLLKLRAPSLS